MSRFLSRLTQAQVDRFNEIQERSQQMREPSEAQVIAGIAAAERESAAWSIQALDDGSCKVDDTNRFSQPGNKLLLRTVTTREFATVQAGRDFVKYRVWRAGIVAAING